MSPIEQELLAAIETASEEALTKTLGFLKVLLAHKQPSDS